MSRFEFHRELGRGAMGTISEATELATGTRVAVKTLHAHLSEEESILARFAREARAASRLKHPRITQVLGHGVLEDGHHFISMEFVEGCNLEEYLANRKTLNPTEVIQIGIQIAEALHFAHEESVIHRDLKPANILLGGGTTHPLDVRVCDFGIAKILNSDGKTFQTMAGVVCGTPDYISPEQAMGRPLDGRSDLYSLGALLFELLVGCAPFTGKNAVEVMERHIHDSVPDLNTLAPNCPPLLSAVVARLLSKKPQDRFSSASQVSAVLKTLGAESVTGEQSWAQTDPAFGHLETAEYATPTQIPSQEVSPGEASEKKPLPLPLMMGIVSFVTAALYGLALLLFG